MPKTYNEIYIDARKKLRGKDIAAYNLEARIIASHAAGKPMNAFMRELNLYTSDEVSKSVDEMIQRRIDGEPVAYITGDWEFYGLPIIVTRDVLIPRVDTEVLAEAAITALTGRKMDARVLDLCTGSGCVGCAIAKNLPATHVVLVDNSPAALAVAKQNVMKNRLNPRVSCVETSALEKPPLMLGSFDLMVCNPPYIPSEDIAGLDASVKDYEPVAALDGGKDGLDFYRAILAKWTVAVRVGGLIMFEVGIGQAGDVQTLMAEAGLQNTGVIPDTQGIERVCFGNV